VDKLTARGFDGEGLSDGQYVIDVVDGKVTGWVPVPDAGVTSVVAGTYIQVDDTDPQNPIVTAMVPMTTLNSSGLPEIVFDSDGHIVYTEAP
jgi:hypothetical protein